ncbi:MAG: DUF3302 domain-containing protein [Neisseriaceae bacterium]|nr:DUF3302 domain-containing protein [Neisseriaceae bacterium]
MMKRLLGSYVVIFLMFFSPAAQASFLEGAALETMANVVSWIVLIVMPPVGIAVFWILHILPEKKAEERKHPNAPAIKVLCLLSLVFGGLLWPLAWLWAYTKPSVFKLAFGRDRLEHHEHDLPESEWITPPLVPAKAGLMPQSQAIDLEAFISSLSDGEIEQMKHQLNLRNQHPSRAKTEKEEQA